MRTYIWARAAAIDWAIIVAAIFIASADWTFIPIAVLVIGNRQHAIAILGHEGAHCLICKTRWVNDLLCNWLVFYPLGICMAQYRSFHWKHHRHTNTPDDPEIALKAVRPNAMQMPFSRGKIMRQLAGDFIGLGIPQLVAFIVHVRPRKWQELGAIAFLIAAIGACIYFGLILVPLLWFGSLYTSFWAFFRYRVWAEHVGGGPGETLVFDVSLLQQLVFFPHNSHLHHEHHEHPSVPFSELSRGQIGVSLCESRYLGLFETTER